MGIFTCFATPYRKRRERRKARAAPSCPSCYTTTYRRECSQLPCGETYCNTCIQRLFTIALAAAQYTPPRCCGTHIPISLAQQVFPASEAADILRKLAARVPNPVHCAKCGAWVLPEHVDEDRDVAVCAKKECAGRTCTLCDEAQHAEGEDCGMAHQRDEKRFRRLVCNSGWAECSDCGFMLSRDLGCREVQCRCGRVELLVF